MGNGRQEPEGSKEADVSKQDKGKAAAEEQQGSTGQGQVHQDPLKSAMLENRLTGQKTTFWCLNYIYSGDLTGVYDEMVELTNPIVVYETGEFDDPKWKDFSKLPHKIYIMKENVESWGVLK